VLLALPSLAAAAAGGYPMKLYLVRELEVGVNFTLQS
jgi:hypothetical protein